MENNIQLIDRVAKALLERGSRLITAESCTGGMVAEELTRQPGSSDWFEGALVTYRLSAKQRLLGVPATMLERYGAVSEPVARAMAEGALRVSDADVSVAITGIAGPDGGDVLTPVGTVWFAWARRDRPDAEPVCVQAAQHRFSGSRDEVRNQAVVLALQGVLESLNGVNLSGS
ncbi:MAG: nicotinamide-nucleotide amidohydrolase family protein [Pseudomonadales bacterium]|nr:CinA family protein [Pseudomonadales bacterium]NIX09732.1 nicotinamide-nucleotide amidohydrolase family protein [Pseudomonadales bacterium]